jgi:deazaflavin-dependent oxidoreductase (nitroreductase family)
MTTSVIGLSIDCADPVALAGFWSEVLGRPVNLGADGENAAYAGSPHNPQWYYNLAAHPEAELHDGTQVRQVRARDLSGAETQRRWDIADALNPNYARRSRQAIQPS